MQPTEELTPEQQLQTKRREAVINRLLEREGSDVKALIIELVTKGVHILHIDPEQQMRRDQELSKRLTTKAAEEAVAAGTTAPIIEVVSSYESLRYDYMPGPIQLTIEPDDKPCVQGLGALFGPSFIEAEVPASPFEFAGLLCEPTNADFSGKVAVIQRGVCLFVEKIIHAQNAGAVAAVLLDFENETSRFRMSNNPDDPNELTPKIPSLLVGRELEERLRDRPEDARIRFDQTLALQLGGEESDVIFFRIHAIGTHTGNIGMDAATTQAIVDEVQVWIEENAVILASMNWEDRADESIECAEELVGEYAEEIQCEGDVCHSCSGEQAASIPDEIELFAP